MKVGDFSLVKFVVKYYFDGKVYKCVGYVGRVYVNSLKEVEKKKEFFFDIKIKYKDKFF